MNKEEGKKESPGPKPRSVEIDGNWQEAMKKALAKKKPPKGWSKEEKDSE